MEQEDGNPQEGAPEVPADDGGMLSRRTLLIIGGAALIVIALLTVGVMTLLFASGRQVALGTMRSSQDSLLPSSGSPASSSTSNSPAA